MKTVLVVDDKPNNIRLLTLDLEDHYRVLTANDGLEGWEVLQANKRQISTILLDRMMPNMNGIEFLERLKADESVAHIPVIMQTAAAEKSQVMEGMRAGAYYYLVKPYDLEVMLAIVDAAVRDYGDYSKLREDLKVFRPRPHIMRDCNFEVQTIDEAHYLASFLANFCPDPERVIMGISELVINGIEHGNLGITYDEKTELNLTNSWEAEVERRGVLPENQSKKVRVNFCRLAKCIVINIIDEGDGFKWEEYLEINPERITHSHGRGIAMSRLKSFDDILYVGKGNEVICRIDLP